MNLHLLSIYCIINLVLVNVRLIEGGRAMENFIVELLRTSFKFIFLALVATGGVFAGKALRINKNKKEASVSIEKE